MSTPSLPPLESPILSSLDIRRAVLDTRIVTTIKTGGVNEKHERKVSGIRHQRSSGRIF